jgi:hypothetical protein
VEKGSENKLNAQKAARLGTLFCRQHAQYGENPHSTQYMPWRIKTPVAFTDRQRALDFEAYLKSPSGRAFSKKRL